MAKQSVALLPSKGFVNSRRRHDVPLDAMTGASHDWLIRPDRVRRRAGSAIVGDTLTAGAETTGQLEAAWDAKARRMLSVALRSLANGFPTWLVLYTHEADKEGQIAFRSTNGFDATKVIGQEFGLYHYGFPLGREDDIPTFRVVPHVYENSYGGLTLARLNYEKARRHLCGGSRDVLLQDREVCWPGYTSAPGRWNGGFNDDDTTGDEVLEVFPLGMIPPLQMPTVAHGNDLGASTVGPWKGSDACYFTVIFENERGELSTYPVPRPPNSAWLGYPGFGYFQVDSANPTHYFDSVTFANIPCGPPGTVARRIARSTKVDVTTTGAGAVVFPSPGDLYFAARIENNTQTTYVLRDGNDLSLDVDPVPSELRKRVWPYRARAMGRFDGRILLGDLRPNPYALLVAPWDNGLINAPIDSLTLYGDKQYYVAVTPTQIVMRTVELGTTTDRAIDIGERSLRTLVDFISTTQDITNVTHHANATVGSDIVQVLASEVVTDIEIGMTVVWAGVFPIGTRVVGIISTVLKLIRVDHFAETDTYSYPEVTFQQISVDADDPAPWGAGVVPGADADENGEELLRTRVAADCAWGSADTTLALTAGDLALAEYITPGMLVYHGDFADGTEVTAVNETTGIVMVSSASTSANAGASEEVIFAYNTGDSARTSSEALVATGAPTDTVSSAQMVVTTPNTAAGTADDNDATLLLVNYTAAGAPPVVQSASEAFAITAITATTIYSVRITLRCKTVHSVNTPTVTFAPLINGVQYGTAVSIPDNAFTNVTFDFDLNPVTSATWTKAAIDAYAWGVQVTALGGAAGDATAITVSEVQVDLVIPQATMDHGYIRSYGNAWPVPLPWRKTYLDRFDARTGSLAFSGASPGHAQNAVNSFYIQNQHTGPADFGRLMGFADLGPAALVFFTRGRTRLWNPRTGTTHADEDYTLSAVSWTRGCRSPYAICSGNGWAIVPSDEGFFAMTAGEGEVLISKALYDSEAPAGERGELEYAISACITASESDTDTYAIFAQVHGSVLSVRYMSSAAVAYPDREVRYDFSASVGRTGLAEVLQADGRPYPWSTPLTYRHSVSAHVAAADGVHHYAAIDSNAGTFDGRVDEIDTGTTDNGTLVRPMGYTGLNVPDRPQQRQALRLRAIMEKAGSGLSFGISRQPWKIETDAEWDDVDIPSSEADDFGRQVVEFKGRVRENRPVEQFRLWDDGSGPCPEVSRLVIDTEVNEDVT